jgi:O-antigen/teichoic acid export membrane protein
MNSEPDLRQRYRLFFSNSMYTFGRQIVNAVLALLISVLLARGLGPQGNGIYSLVILVPVVTLSVLNLGIGPGTVYVTGKKRYSTKTIIGSTVFLAAILAVVGSVLAFLIINFYSETLFPGVPKSLLNLILISIPFYFLIDAAISLMQGFQDFIAFNLIHLLTRIINLVLLVIFLFVLKVGNVGAIVAWIGTYIILLISIPFTTGEIHWRTLWELRVGKAAIREIVGYGVRAHPANLATFLVYRIDRFLLNLLVNPAEVGVYVVAVGLVERLWMVSSSVSTVLFPRIADSKETESAKKTLTTLVSRYVLWITAILGIGMAVLSRPLVNILFGEQYSRAVGAMVVLIPGVILLSVSRTLSSDIAGRGYPEFNSYVAVASLIANVTLNLLLIPRLGLLGAAAASTITYSLTFIVKLIIFSSLSNVSWKLIIVPQKGDLQRFIRLGRDWMRAD